MRDRSSAVPETVRGLAYEKALIAAGREHHALALLEIRGVSNPDTAVSSMPLAIALAALLDAPALVASLEEWDAGLLATILESTVPNSKIRNAPEGFPESLLPFIAMAHCSAGGDFVKVFSPAGQEGGIRIPGKNDPEFVDFAMAMSVPEWREWRKNEKGIWTLSFGNVAEIHIMNAPDIFFGVYPTLPDLYTDEIWKIAIFMPVQE